MNGTYKIIVHSSVKDNCKSFNFGDDEAFKDLIKVICQEIKCDPHPDGITKVYNDVHDEISYLFEYKGFRMRMVYEVREEYSEIGILFVGHRRKDTGYIVMEVPKDLR